MKRNIAVRRVVLQAVLCCLLATIPSAYADSVSGAIFTTLDDGAAVNLNLYPSRQAVYLSGGPASGSPGLANGDYVFQVTDPSGKILLSVDAAMCRVVRMVDARIVARLDWDGHGISPFDFAPHGGTDYCHKPGRHEQHAHSAGAPAVTVQLYPFEYTLSRSGGYKVWLTPVADFVAGCGGESGLMEVGCGYSPGNLHGFLVPRSKTDNFRVR